MYCVYCHSAPRTLYTLFHVIHALFSSSCSSSPFLRLHRPLFLPFLSYSPNYKCPFCSPSFSVEGAVERAPWSASTDDINMFILPAFSSTPIYMTCLSGLTNIKQPWVLIPYLRNAFDISSPLNSPHYPRRLAHKADSEMSAR